VAAAIGRRAGRPLCILDLAVPRDVEPAVTQLENVFLYDIDDLREVAAQAAAGRRDDIPAAERIVSEEVERFWAWYSALVVVPVLKELRDHMERIRAAELERALRRLRHLKSDDGAQLEQFSHALLNKFLHQPTIALKEAASAGRGYGLLEALKRLFGLERRQSHEFSPSGRGRSSTSLQPSPAESCHAHDLEGQQASYPDQRLHRRACEAATTRCVAHLC